MNNLIIRSSQLDGVFVTYETMQKLVDQLGALCNYQFNVLQKYVEEHCLTDGQMKALFGTQLNVSKTHRIEGYFGPRTIHSAASLLSPIQRQKVLSYYCDARNYEIADWNGNIADGKSPMKGPCLTFLVKFMEEIIGFKNTPEGVYNLGQNGQLLTKAYRRLAPLVGFNNNFQPEDYLNAPNKSVYMRGLTVVQKILALHWLTMGSYAFREDLLVIKDETRELKKKRKARPPKKPRKIKKPKTFALTRDMPGFPSDITNIPVGTVTNSISQVEFRRQPLFQQVQYLYEMLGGSMAGRCNQKLAPDERVSRADFMAASLNQQTMWLYRQLQRMDEDGGEDSGHRKHLGKYYKIGGLATAITSLKKLSRGRVTHQTRYLGKRAMKHETKIQRAEKNIKGMQKRMRKAEASIAAIKKKVFVSKDQLKDQMDKLGDAIGKGAGVISKLNLINMIVGYAMDAVLMTIASTALGIAVESKYRLDDHDKRFKKVYKFLTDDLLARFNFIWEELAHLSEDISLVHLEVQRTDNRLADLGRTAAADRGRLGAVEQEVQRHAGRLESLAGNQDSLMEFRNRVEVLLTVVLQFFERNGISFTDQEGGVVDVSAIRQELEGAYNYLRELVDGQALEIRAVGRLASARIDALERQLEEEREAAAAARRVLEDRVAAQDVLIRRLGERLDALERGAGSADLAELTGRVERLEGSVSACDGSVAELRGLADDINLRLGSLDEYARRELQNQAQQLAAGREAVDALRTQVGNIARTAERIPDIETSVRLNRDSINFLNGMVSEINTKISKYDAVLGDSDSIASRIDALDSAVSGLRSSVWSAMDRISSLESRASNSESSIRQHSDSISSLNSASNRMTQICREVKTQYIVKSWVPSQTTDKNGFMRLSMTSFPSDIVSYMNDYIISIVPYDVYVSTYDRVFVGWCDYNNGSSHDREINIIMRYVYDSGIGKVGSGQHIKIWYWAHNPAENYPL